MSEQKYYVRLKSIIVNVRDYSDDEHYISGANFYLDVLKEFSPDEVKHEFTKSELAEIMDGVFYKRADYCEFMELPPDWVMDDKTDKWLCEWINPLIELVKVEEE